MHRYRNLSRVGAVSALLCTAIAGHAQTITGNVTGIVTDPSGAVIAHAQVTATNVDTGVATPTTSNNDGIYDIRFLQIGKYKVTVAAPGFADSTFGPFTLETGQTAKIDAKVAPAGSQQNVNVTEDIAPLLNTENATLATTLDSRAIENIPMVGRNIVSLTMFLPGAVSTSPNGFVGNSAIAQGGAGTNTVSVNGNRQQANQYLLDGMNVNETLNDTPGYNPSPDAIGQVQVISANANAEYGNVNGGDILYQTKSGTNKFHGSAYYSLDDWNLDANTWSNKHTSTITPQSSYTRNIFGGSVGGPIFKDKLFFFGDYQGGRYHTGGAANATVLTDKERLGDFSELLDPGLMCSDTGGVCQSVAATSTTPALSPNHSLIQLYNGTDPSHPAYANNQIGAPVNPVAKYLFAHPELYPHANQAPSASDSPAANNYRGTQTQRVTGDQFDVKVDYKASNADSLFVRYSQSTNLVTTTSPLPVQFNSAPSNPVHGVAINEVHTFGPSLVNEFRAGYTRIQSIGAALIDTTGVFGLNGDNILGIGAATGGVAQAFEGFAVQQFGNPASPSNISASSGTEYTGLGNADLGTNFTDNTFLYGDNLTWLKGQHTFKFGVQFQRQQQNNFYPGNDGSLGGFYYLGAATANGTGTDANGFNSNGYTVADFLLNQTSFVSKGGVSGPVGMRSWRDAYFAQDDWKALPNLTINIGIRYEYDQPIYEVNNKMSTIDPANPSVILLAGSDAAKAAGYSNRGLVDPFYGSIMPRVGFAYSVNPKTVIRGGYGIQNFMEGTGANLRMTTNLPFQSTYEASGNNPTATTAGNFFQVENGFSNPASGAAPSGGVYNVWDKKIKPAFIGEYSLTAEYQATNTTSFQVGYLGESGQHLITANAANQLHNPCVIGGVIQAAATPTPSAACLAQAPAPFQATPGVGYNGTIRLTDSNAMMNYNALQTTVRQRLWQGLEFTVNYTWSHAMTNSTGFYGVPSINSASAYAENTYNLHTEYGPAGQDVRNAVNWNLVYDLPVGRGRTFAGNMPRLLDEVVGGWQIGMTGIEYSGFPTTITASNNSDVNGNSQRANHYRKLKVVDRTINNWFGTDPSAVPCTTPGVDNGVCAYGQPAAGTFGTAAPSSERAPGYQTYGASVTKNFTTFREQKINFRADADNLLNSAEWGNPDSNIQDAQFGNISNQGTPIRSNPRSLQLSMHYIF